MLLLMKKFEANRPGENSDGKKLEAKNGEKNGLPKNGEKNGFPKKKLLKPGWKDRELKANGSTTKFGVKKKSGDAKSGRWKKTGANSSPRSANGKSQKPLTKTEPAGVHE